MAVKAKPLPVGYHTVIPYLVVRDVAEAIAFYRKAFGMREIMRLLGPDGRSVMHGEVQIGDSTFFLGAEAPSSECKAPLTLNGSSIMLCLYVEDADTVYQQAVAAGGKAIMPLEDMFWGDRMGTVEDPFGHRWSVATHLEDVPPEEIQQRAVKFFASKTP